MKGNGSEMSQTALYRISAVVLLVGAVLVTVGNLLGPQGGAREAVASGMYYPAATRRASGRPARLGGLAGRLPAPAGGERRPRLCRHDGCVCGGDAPDSSASL